MTSFSRFAVSSAVLLGSFLSTHSLAQAPSQSSQSSQSQQGMQGAPSPMSMGMHPHMMGHDRMPGMMNNPKMQERREAKRAERHQKYLNEMKVYLQLQAHQETAWLAFSGAMKTPMKRPAPIITSELEKMTTPERIDKMMALKAERDTEMTNRMIASKTFYGSLTPTQQKVFDTHTQNFFAHNSMDHQPKMRP